MEAQACREKETRRCKTCESAFSCWVDSKQRICSRCQYIKYRAKWKCRGCDAPVTREFTYCRGCQKKQEIGTVVGEVNGYPMVRTPDGGRVPEHIYVMEKHLGRRLHRYERVLHLDGIRRNNDLGNLWVKDTRTPYEPKSVRKARLEWAHRTIEVCELKSEHHLD